MEGHLRAVLNPAHGCLFHEAWLCPRAWAAVAAHAALAHVALCRRRGQQLRQHHFPLMLKRCPRVWTKPIGKELGKACTAHTAVLWPCVCVGMPSLCVGLACVAHVWYAPNRLALHPLLASTWPSSLLFSSLPTSRRGCLLPCQAAPAPQGCGPCGAGWGTRRRRRRRRRLHAWADGIVDAWPPAGKHPDRAPCNAWPLPALNTWPA